MKSALQQRAEAAAERFRTARKPVVIEEQLEEEILFLPADSVAPLFETSTWIGKAKAQQLVESFTTRGAFRSRRTVESDFTLVQALPVVVVRNRSGDLLRLKRREQHKHNPLHGKIVIWAGGHVRREDGVNGPPSDGARSASFRKSSVSASTLRNWSSSARSGSAAAIATEPGVTSPSSTSGEPEPTTLPSP